MLSQYKNIDEFIFVGIDHNVSDKIIDYYGNGKALYEGAKSIPFLNNRSIFINDLKKLSNYLKYMQKLKFCLYEPENRLH